MRRVTAIGVRIRFLLRSVCRCAVGDKLAFSRCSMALSLQAGCGAGYHSSTKFISQGAGEYGTEVTMLSCQPVDTEVGSARRSGYLGSR